MWDASAEQELLEIFTGLIKIDSSNPPGHENAVTDYISSLLEKEDIKCHIFEKEPGRSNLWAKLEGGPKKPIILLSHIDVVPADPSEWKHPPFEGINDNGVIYGRGAIDTKHLTAMEIMTMLLLKREGISLNRPVILVATADEENGSAYGMGYLEAEHPELFPDGYVISEGGGFILSQDGQRFRTITCGEKGRCEMTLSVTRDEKVSIFDPTGSSAGQLLEAMARISAYEAPEVILSPIECFRKAVSGDLTNSTMRNLWQYSTRSCLAINAYEHTFNILSDCVELKSHYQFMPETSQNETISMMNDLLDETNVSWKLDDWSEGYVCDMDNSFYHLLDEVSRRYDPDTTMLPILALGRTDGRFIRENVYGYSPMLGDVPFSQVLKMIHQKDERITEDSLYFGGQVIYQAVRDVANCDNTGEGG